MRLFLRCFICGLTLLLPFVGVAEDAKDEGKDTGPLQEAARQYDYFENLAENFEAKLASGGRLQLAGKPFLKWTIGSSWHGSFYVWTYKDQPMLVGGFLADSGTPDQRRSFIEMHSLADEPLAPITIAGIKNYEWSPDFKRTPPLVLKDSPEPAANPRLRVAQMRDLANKLSVTMFEMDGQQELRLMPKPLYRYPASNDVTRDGAIFAFANGKGTDPEFLLAVECDPQTKWRLRPMRFSTLPLDVKYDDAVVWSVSKYAEATERTKLSEPYMIVTLSHTTTQEFNKIRDKAIKPAASTARP